MVQHLAELEERMTVLMPPRYRTDGPAAAVPWSVCGRSRGAPCSARAQLLSFTSSWPERIIPCSVYLLVV